MTGMERKMRGKLVVQGSGGGSAGGQEGNGCQWSRAHGRAFPHLRRKKIA